MKALNHHEIKRIQLMAFEFAIRQGWSPEKAFYEAVKFIEYSNEMEEKMKSPYWFPLDKEDEE